MTKVALSLDKRQWHPSPLPGQIVLISTVASTGIPNIAPKSWFTMVAFEGPLLAFGCNRKHTTYANLEESSEFVVNVPSASLADRIWGLLNHESAVRIEQSGFKLSPSTHVATPLITECIAHFECKHEGTRFFGDEVLVFGRIVAASIDEECLSRDGSDPYARLRPLFFLEDGVFGSLDCAQRIGARPPADQALFVIETGPLPGENAELSRAHVDYLADLSRDGLLVTAGEFSDGGTMYVVRLIGLREASDLAAADPISASARVHVRRWRRSF